MTLPIWVTTDLHLGTLTEGDSFSYTLLYSNPGPSPTTITIIAGSLPDGLSMSTSGVITGTIATIDEEQTYYFTVRLKNPTGVSDRTFSISVLNDPAEWNDVSDLGSVVFFSRYETNFYITDNGNRTQSFLKIAGELPSGIRFDESGKLFGFPDEVDVNTVYNFTIRSFLNDVVFEDRAFTLEIVTSGNRAPIWNTPAGLLANINTITPYSYQLSASDPDGDTVTFTATGLPAGITMTTAGLLQGQLTDTTQTIHTFNVTATDGIAPVSRLFRFNANGQEDTSITWITPAGSLGEINEGEKSLFGVKAVTSSGWIRYELVSGDLPDGMKLDINSGDIWGMANEQGSTTSYTFEIRAYNPYISENRTFSITVNDHYTTGATRIYASIWGADKLEWYDLFTSNLIPSNSWFRQGDDQYGLVEKGKILITESLDNPSRDEVFHILEGVRRTYVTFGKIESAKAVHNGEIVYEVLYRKIYDDFDGSLIEFDDPQTGELYKNGGIEHYRDRLLELGLSGSDENLPLWMTSEQIMGKPETVLGFTPAIVFAYVKAGTGEDIASRMNAADVQKQKLLNRRLRVDRVIMEAAADSSFEPEIVLFDNEY